MKKILVMLTKSPYRNDENLIRLYRCKKDDVAIFAQDSVYSFSSSSTMIAKLILAKMDLGVRIFASAPDSIARGITPFAGVKLVDYSQQIDLICECELTI